MNSQVRFALSRGFWRLGHALVIDVWQGSRSSMDSALASVAFHPLTCAMAASISHLVGQTVAPQILDMGALPDPVLSTVERKGKVFQLILHGLTVANDGNTGALAVLAACVMVTHFTLLCARNDFAALRALLLDNEAAADESNAAAFAWLMHVCNPAQFTVGGTAESKPGLDRAGFGFGEGRVSGAGERQDRYGADGKRHRRRAWKTRAGEAERVGGRGGVDNSRDEDDDDKGDGWGSDEEAKKMVLRMTFGVAEKCLMWVLVLRFRQRLRLALTAPLDNPEEPLDNPEEPSSHPDAHLAKALENVCDESTHGRHGPLEGISLTSQVDTTDSASRSSSESDAGARRGLSTSWNAGSPATKAEEAGAKAAKMLVDLSASAWQRLKTSTKPTANKTKSFDLRESPDGSKLKSSSSSSLKSSSSSSLGLLSKSSFSVKSRSVSFENIKHHLKGAKHNLKDAMQRAHARTSDACAAAVAAASSQSSPLSTRGDRTPTQLLVGKTGSAPASRCLSQSSSSSSLVPASSSSSRTQSRSVSFENIKHHLIQSEASMDISTGTNS